MFRFLPGLILIQAASLGVVLFVVDPSRPWAWARAGAVLLVTTLIVAFWFDAIARQMRKDAVADLHQQHAREREKLKVQAEREKHRVVQNSQKQLARQAAKVQARANMKVGASLAVAAGVGVVMVMAQFVTFGLLTVSTAGGALGGYLWRGRQLGRQLPSSSRSLKQINSR